MKRDIEILLRRAESFMTDARSDYDREDFDLAMFHIEQACQLIIKAKLLDLTGYYEKTHSLRRLLEDLSEVFRRDELKSFVRENWTTLRNLEFAYIASRYLPEEFMREEAEEAFDVYDKLRNLLWSS
ncbi:HEPN domain-containing protein [Geoglobus acetivorans]|uniref:HEPN domain-containing protein n=1 Tax=Geoglobus acetivorans TaxID=565033 RepID=A0ABZ3H1J3_GEOAI|nr:HEPN domain-containing protein [Geoglobus acetivorans]